MAQLQQPDYRNLYHYENKFFDDPKRCGGIWVYQLGEMLCRPTTLVANHDQKYYELTYVLNGKGKVATNDEEFPVSEGDCVISFPGEVHRVASEPKEPLRYAFVSFMDNGSSRRWQKIIDGLHAFYGNANKRLVSMPDDSYIFYQLFSEIKSDEVMSEEMIDLILSKFMVRILRACEKTEIRNYSPRIRDGNILAYQVREYLQQNICDVERLSDLSSVFNYNYRYISRCFKDICGEMLGDYFLRCRMDFARERIREGYSVTAVSEMLKYSSIHVFSRSFKTYFHVTPSEYKKQIDEQYRNAHDNEKNGESYRQKKGE